MMATERQNKQGSGANCAVNGCSWNQRKLNSLLNLPCFDHKSSLKKDCSCAPPYKLHRMPDDPDLRRQWLAALKRKFPPQNLFVCSYHFVGKKPTTENPVPELFLGYTKVVKSRRVLVRSRLTPRTVRLSCPSVAKENESRQVQLFLFCHQQSSFACQFLRLTALQMTRIIRMKVCIIIKILTYSHTHRFILI